MTVDRRPWDRQPDEPLEAYARFLSYRNLGPGRSLPRAQRCHAGGRQGKNWQRACGAWNNESAKFDWPSRAAAWDVAQLSTHGEALATAWISILVNAVTKAAQTLCDPKCAPRTFRDVLAVIGAVGQYLTPEIISPLVARQHHNRDPADSCSLDRLRTFLPMGGDE